MKIIRNIELQTVEVKEDFTDTAVSLNAMFTIIDIIKRRRNQMSEMTKKYQRQHMPDSRLTISVTRVLTHSFELLMTMRIAMVSRSSKHTQTARFLRGQTSGRDFSEWYRIHGQEPLR